MRKPKTAQERTPPKPKDKPLSYDDDSGEGRKQGAKQEKADPQKTRENLEHDPSKRERDPGMTKK